MLSNKDVKKANLVTLLLFCLMLNYSCCSNGERHIFRRWWRDDDGCLSWSQKASWRTRSWSRPWLVQRGCKTPSGGYISGMKYRWESVCALVHALRTRWVRGHLSLCRQRLGRRPKKEFFSSLPCSGWKWYAMVWVECVCAVGMIWVHRCVVCWGIRPWTVWEKFRAEMLLWALQTTDRNFTNIFNCLCLFCITDCTWCTIYYTVLRFRHYWPKSLGSFIPN